MPSARAVRLAALLGAAASLSAQQDSCALAVTPQPVTRGLPHTFHDQAQESISAIYAAPLVLVARRRRLHSGV